MNRLCLFGAIALWAYLLISALLQDSWIVAALLGAVCAVMGIVVALSTWTERNLRHAKAAAAYIMISGLGLILYAFITQFFFGPGSQ